ncbi:MAG: 4Fe-4S single cluster domain-containing protein [Candidatus Wallbacteria bacterium]
MDIYINKIHYPVKELGNGENRLGIWLQGCPIHCNGCINKDTWPLSDERKISFDELKKILAKFKKKNICGVTITGGEPFYQPAALLELALFLKEITGGDIFVYSGYSFEFINEKYPDILKNIDVLVSEPFKENETDKLIWRGSDNQKIWLLSEKARKIYPENINEIEYTERKMQYSIVGDELYMIGIPARKDLDKFYELLKERGLNCEKV